jgi:glycosyl hydrolase family 39 (putative alpha-L-iduronidase)
MAVKDSSRTMKVSSPKLKPGRSSELTIATVIMAATLLNSCGLVGRTESPTTLPGTNSGQLSLKPSGNRIPVIFFGMHFHRLDTVTSWPKDLDIHTWRLLGTYVMWPNLEPQKGQWNFALLDKLLNLAQEHHVQVLMPLVLSPPWASSRPAEPSSYSPGNAAVPNDLEDWHNYIRTVAIRCKGRIHEYEIWNEPNLKDFYTGTVPQLVEMARIAYATLKEVDPTNQVSSPPATGIYGVSWFDQYLQAGGGKYSDVIGYHVYVNPAPPEEMVALIQQVEAVMSKHGVRNKELWDTETGWAIQNTQSVVTPAGEGFNSIVLSPDVAAAYLARSYILSWASGVSRLYWYSWDNYVMGLVDHDGKTLKSPAIAYGEIQKWLIGARMDSCDTDANGAWTCVISREGGYRGWIVWNPNQTQKIELPRNWDARRMRDLRGSQAEISTAQIQIGPSPILLESSGK